MHIQVPYSLPWVHVNVVPLVLGPGKAAEVQKLYQWSRADDGPFLTAEQYEQGAPPFHVHRRRRGGHVHEASHPHAQATDSWPCA